MNVKTLAQIACIVLSCLSKQIQASNIPQTSSLSEKNTANQLAPTIKPAAQVTPIFHTLPS